MQAHILSAKFEKKEYFFRAFLNKKTVQTLNYSRLLRYQTLFKWLIEIYEIIMEHILSENDILNF